MGLDCFIEVSLKRAGDTIGEAEIIRKLVIFMVGKFAMIKIWFWKEYVVCFKTLNAFSIL